jgi:hypothetical protein
MINTFPPILSILALGAMLVGYLWRSRHLKQFALLLIVIVPLSIIPVFFTGRASVVVIGNQPDVPLDLIGEHQESVTLTWIATGIAGLVAAVGLFLYRGDRPLSPAFVAATLLLSLAADGLLVRTAHLGGSIRHPEARSTFVPGGGTGQ